MKDVKDQPSADSAAPAVPPTFQAPGDVQAPAGPPAGGPVPGDGEQDRTAALEAELAAARAEAAANWDRFLRERAEQENYKKRLDRTYADQARRARKELLLKLLGVLDNLDRAIAYQRTSAGQVDAETLLMGLRLTHQQLRDLLSQEGIQEVPAAGQPFDPAVHEAVAVEATAGAPDGQVIEELQKGYRLGDELLRPARVRVATTPE